MCKYKRGHVVWGLCGYSDRTGVKPRPVIILKSEERIIGCNHFIIECYTLESHHNGKPGIKVIEKTPEFIECGFENDTFINFSVKAWLAEKFMRVPPPSPPRKNPMGFCSFVDKIK